MAAISRLVFSVGPKGVEFVATQFHGSEFVDVNKLAPRPAVLVTDKADPDAAKAGS